MAEFVLFSVPALIYVIVQSRGPDRNWRQALARVGATWGSPSGYGVALLLVLPLLLAAWLTVVLVPADVLDQPAVAIAALTSVGAVLGVVLRAAGEEVFFRGLLGGVLMRRLGFAWGNLAQATIFLLPHLALLLVDTRLWPILPVQFAVGWLLGWLRHGTGSFVPGAVVHAAVNLVAGVAALQPFAGG